MRPFHCIRFRIISGTSVFLLLMCAFVMAKVPVERTYISLEYGPKRFADEDPKDVSQYKFIFSAKGKSLAGNAYIPDCRSWIYWDNNLLRETLNGCKKYSSEPYSITKYTGESLSVNIAGKIIMISDILVDWRSKLIAELPGEIRNYCTTIPAEDKRLCLIPDAYIELELPSALWARNHPRHQVITRDKQKNN